MRNKIILPILILLVSINISCKNNLSAYEDLQPGRRDYIWTIDTLYSPNNILQCISGSSPSDVWGVGGGGITAYDGVWHYDGKIWKPYPQHIETNAETIFSFSSDNVWLGGNDGKIFHYNGTKWEPSFIYEKKDAYLTIITGIMGNSPNDIYATALIVYHNPHKSLGAILHYDGKYWKEVHIMNDYSQFITIKTDENSNVFTLCELSDSINSFSNLAYYECNNKGISKLASFPRSEIIFGSIDVIGKEIAFLIGKKLYKCKNGKLDEKMSFDGYNINYEVAGKSWKDFFIVMRDGIAHYNGQNIEYIYHYANLNWNALGSPVIFENDVFFTIKDLDHGENLILHGKLKQSEVKSLKK